MTVPRGAAVQDVWPEFDCYGCGPANESGLQIKSYLAEDGESLVCTFDPDPAYTSGTPNVMYGGTIASLIDCHSIWTAITFAHREEGLPLEDHAIGYVTANLEVSYLEPTPLDEPIRVRAEVDGEIGRKVTVSSSLGPEGETTARGEVLAVETTDRFS